MKKAIFTLLTSGVLIAGQAQELPQPSPHSTLKQRVGLTDITIDYSRPGVKDREIFGGLVPYEKLWRTGANAATTIKFNSNVTFAGEEVEAGEYAIFTIPRPDEWTVILNSDTEQGGTGNYTKEKDVLRVEVSSKEVEEMVETFRIDVNNIRTGSAHLVFQWAHTKVEVPMEFNYRGLAETNIDKALEDAGDDKKWQVYRNAAGFYNQNTKEYDKALNYINRSLKRHNESWYSYLQKAEILASMEKYEKAIEMAEQALEMGREAAEGDDGSEFAFERSIEQKMEKWQSMI